MAYPKSDRIQFPSRPARLNVSHPMCARGVGRGVICVANQNGSATELQSGLNYNWVTLANQAGEMTSWGPACFARSTTSGGVVIPNNMNLAAGDVMTTAAIFQARTLNGTNAVMALTSSSGGGLSVALTTGKISYVISGVTLQAAWPNAIPGHVYIAVCSTRVSGINPRDWGWCVDLTTGQAWYAFDNAGAISFTWTANCSLVTYAGGTAGDTRVFAGAAMPVALTQEQQFDWVVNDPWGLWFADEVPVIQGLAASKPLGATINLGGNLSV